MTDGPKDQWASGDAYEFYMGRWSRSLARAFVEWLSPETRWNWLDVGCGTGALTRTLCELSMPASVVGCDQAAPFIEHARHHISDPHASFVVSKADALPSKTGGFDAVVSGLVLNFLPEPEQAVKAMRERVRPTGMVSAYVWDYRAGLEFLRHFWDEAVAADPKAAPLDEGARFPLCQAEALSSLLRTAGLSNVESTQLDIPTDFSDFDDYWRPFLGGTGPAPTYVLSLDDSARASLRARLERRLGSGGIHLRAKAWAVRGIALIAFGMLLGCETTNECVAKGCERVDREPVSGDFVIELDPETALVHVSVEGHESDQALRSGQIVFTPSDPACVPSPSSPCTITLARLRLELASSTVPSSEGDLELEEPVVSVRAPVNLVDQGGGYVLSGQNGAQTCATVNGSKDSAFVALSEDANMNIDIPNQGFGLDGQFPLRFRNDDAECKKYDGSATVIAAGKMPWTELP